MYMSIQIVTENTLQNVMHNRNLQKFCMFLLNAYPILDSCTVLCSVTEDTRPACALSRSDVKIFTLFVNWCKHFIIAMPASVFPFARNGQKPDLFCLHSSWARPNVREPAGGAIKG